MVIPALLIGGLVFPLFALIVGWLNVAGRIIYCFGYFCKGPNLRLPGALLSAFSVYLLLITSVGGLIYEMVKA